jgi:hypothetical protein
MPPVETGYTGVGNGEGLGCGDTVAGGVSAGEGLPLGAGDADAVGRPVHATVSTISSAIAIRMTVQRSGRAGITRPFWCNGREPDGSC